MRRESIRRKSFSKISSAVEMPDLLDIQVQSFRDFLQHDVFPSKRRVQGLQEVFLSVFPITDSRDTYLLEFVEYYLDVPKYTVEECRERGVTYSVPLKAKLRLSIRDAYSEKTNYVDTIEQVVYLGNFPFMTEKGTFIINGAERIIVNQLHRSPGVFFDEKVYPNGTRTYSARIIPFRGSWLEFMTDTNDVLYVYIDQGRKFPVTTLLRALGCSTDEEVLRLFNLIEEISLDGPQIKKYVGREVFFSQDEVGVVDEKTGEVVLERDGILEAGHLSQLRKLGVSNLKFVVSEDSVGGSKVINNTLKKDTVQSEKDAVEAIYRQLRAGDPPDLETARALIDRLFFNPKRYDLGRVGRYRMNRKLGLDIPEDMTVLTNEDFVAIIKYDGTSIDPLEIFIKSGMTDYTGATERGNGQIGASFREIPENGRGRVLELAQELDDVGLGGFMEIGIPNQPLHGIPVKQDCVGAIVIGGLNPIAILVENGMDVYSKTLSGLLEYNQLFSYEDLDTEVTKYL